MNRLKGGSLRLSCSSLGEVAAAQQITAPERSIGYLLSYKRISVWSVVLLGSRQEVLYL